MKNWILKFQKDDVVVKGPEENSIELKDSKMSLADELLKYSQLQKEGFLTMEEFNQIKSKLIGGIL